MNYFSLSPDVASQVKKIKGPIVVFGAGGFIGFNLLNSLLLYRDDVYGVSRDPKKNWRFLSIDTDWSRILTGDINKSFQLKKILKKIKPKTVFNLSAFGAYAEQKDCQLIYQTNFNANIQIIELLKQTGFERYIYAGSSSEYGLNCSAPGEDSELIPNSHYAVSKVASYYAIKYYGKIEKLPVVDLRLYAVYGPWEEADRLIPKILEKAKEKAYPPFVNSDISRDFIYVTDVSSAFILAASKGTRTDNLFGESFNVGTGKKTKIEDLAYLVKDMFKLDKKPVFGKMDNRVWDLTDWYAKVDKIKKILSWESTVDLKKGLLLSTQWQKKIGYSSGQKK